MRRVFIKAFKTLQRIDVLCLGSFQTFTNGEFNLLTFFEGLTAFAYDLAEVNEYVTLSFTGNEPKTFFVIEPFNGSCN